MQDLKLIADFIGNYYFLLSGWAPDYIKELWRPAKHDEWALGCYERKVNISKGWNWHSSTSVAADF